MVRLHELSPRDMGLKIAPRCDFFAGNGHFNVSCATNRVGNREGIMVLPGHGMLTRRGSEWLVSVPESFVNNEVEER